VLFLSLGILLQSLFFFYYNSLVVVLLPFVEYIPYNKEYIGISKPPTTTTRTRTTTRRRTTTLLFPKTQKRTK